MRSRRTSIVVLVAGLALATTSCGAGSGGSNDGPPQDAPASAGEVRAPRTGPMTPRDPQRISASERAAIEALGSSNASPPAGPHSHGHGPGDTPVELPLFTGDAGTFADQWLRAQRSTESLDTVEEISALGYVRASAPVGGVGTHWVLWSQITKPFDPARPAMVLFDERRRPAQLAGYSYWLQSPTEPVGFAGDNDRWHQHTGLCVVNGWVDREESDGAASCAGTFLAGGDLWMLHAWVAPRLPSKLGRFSTVNPLLCPPLVGTPDDMRCPT